MMKMRGRLMFNMADLVVYVPPREMFWPSSMNELLVIGFFYPLIPQMPWQLRGTPKVMELVMEVYLMLWDSTWDSKSVLNQIWLPTKRVASILGVLEWVLLLI